MGTSFHYFHQAKFSKITEHTAFKSCFQVSFSLFGPLFLSTYCLQILDQYKESHDTREREGAAASSNLPHNVILVGHSMGGFVARAAAVHPRLRKSAVQTILTLSSPHQ